MNNREGSAAFVAPLLVLALGHMISNLLRTLPAISADVLARDIGTTPEGLASLTGAYHLTFAMGQIPLGVALDRFGVKPVALTLMAVVTLAAAASAMVGGPVGFLLTQVALGLGSCGALLCPMTLAAKILSPAKFGLWSGLIQGTGNTGMLLSASPLAWVVENFGWRMGFWVAAGLALLVALLVARLVPAPVPAACAGWCCWPSPPSPSSWGCAASGAAPG
ncbi:MFS transporter [Roseomonas sp. ACRSG]|nr:MFS transporter [Roseomonas sp. ACRSG]